MKPYTWEGLASSTLRRQFPRIRGRGTAAVVELVRRVGPIQSQVARSPFVTVSSRLPGATYDAITAAYESFDVVRGSNVRGTVHTCVREHHPLLDTITRRSQAMGWRRNLKLEKNTVADVQAGIEDFATGEWRTPDELRAHLVSWLESRDGPDVAELARTTGIGRAFAHVHSAMIRRPMGDGGWDRQSAPVYRVAAAVLGVARSPWLADPDAALVALTRQHLTAYGPANRRDIAWWSGEGLRNVDAALATLADELTGRPGPDGQIYYDLLDAPKGGGADVGVRLVAEFDALVVAYDPKTRDRFLDPDHLPHVWLQQNGTFSSAVLSEGRLSGSWKFDGTVGERRIEVRMFPGRRRLQESDLADQVNALEKALAIDVSDVTVTTAE
ncbi:MAG: crosslink repair DNA glycosylase YcaQ family protein [Nocardioidaceae bacterium]